MKFLNSKLWIGIIFIAIILILCLSFTSRKYWWCYIDVFFFFMGAFCQLMALTLGVKIPKAGAKLSMIAAIFAIIGIVALLVEAILLFAVF